MKLHYNLLAFIASSLRVTDEDSVSEIVQYDPRFVFECFHCNFVFSLTEVFVNTELYVVRHSLSNYFCISVFVSVCIII